MQLLRKLYRKSEFKKEGLIGKFLLSKENEEMTASTAFVEKNGKAKMLVRTISQRHNSQS